MTWNLIERCSFPERDSCKILAALKKLPSEFLSGFVNAMPFRQRAEIDTVVGLEALMQRKFVPGFAEETDVAQINIYDSHWGITEVFHQPVLNIPKGAGKIYVEPMTFCGEIKLGGIGFNYHRTNYFVEFKFGERAKRIIDERQSKRYLEERGLIAVRGTDMEIIQGAG